MAVVVTDDRDIPGDVDAGNRLARNADLVIGIGARWSDFTTASMSAVQDPSVRLVHAHRRRHVLMLSSELATPVAEGIPPTVILVDNQGYMSIGALSRSLGQAGFGTHFKGAVNGGPILDTPGGDGLATAAERLPVDFAGSAASLGAEVIRAGTIAQLRAALSDTAEAAGPVVICIETDRYDGVPAYEGWWDVPVAEVSEDPIVQDARDTYTENRQAQRQYLEAP